MKKHKNLLVILGVVMVLGVGVVIGATGKAQAQTSGMPTAQEALLTALGDYLTLTGDDHTWQLGEIKSEGSYAYSIAGAEGLEGSEQGYLLLLARQQDDDLWYAVAPKLVSAALYNDWLNAMPVSLLDTFDKSFYYQYSAQQLANLLPQAVSLHHFPWPITKSAVVTQKDGDYHASQIDFVLRYTNDVYASKPGVVVFVKEVSDIGGCDINLWRYANMVVVQHSATEYTWYLHLVKNSVPVEVGDLIGYGTKIGEQGATGFSCGSTGIHLHFMSSTAIPPAWPDPTVASLAPWPPAGTIVPVDFIESSWAALTVGSIYVSQNAPAYSGCAVGPTSAAFYENTYCSGLVAESSTSGLLTLQLDRQAENIESLNLPTGWSAALYENENEFGPRICFNSLDEMLWDNNFSDGIVVANRTSWLRVYTAQDCPYPDAKSIKFYRKINFTGIPVWGMVGARSTDGPAYIIGSIYLPDGYTATIYDRDGLTGNSLCLEGSVLNLGEFGWSDRRIQSVKMEFGGSCTPPSENVPQPMLVSPADNADLWGPGSPKICWSVPEGTTGLQYNALVYSDTNYYQSGWMVDTCWTVGEMAAQYGAYSWHVQAKNADGEIGPWSVTRTFTYQEDLLAPVIAITTPLESTTVVRPRTVIDVDGQDADSGIAHVYYFGWFDNGSGGYDWYYLGEDVDGQDGWRFVWNLSPVVSPDASVWAYAEDYSGNFASDMVAGVVVADSLEIGDGYTGRGGRMVLPAEGPSVEEIPGYMPPSEAGETLPKEETPTEVIKETPIEENNPPGETGEPNPAPVVPALPAISGARQPEAGETFYGISAPALCWQPVQSSEEVEYQVVVRGDSQINSPWITQTCWTPNALDGQYGSFDWQVQARSSAGAVSPWSERYAFSLRPDEQPPQVTMLSPQLGSAFADKIFVEAEAQDLESGVAQVYFLAWYDAGDGLQWHTIGSLQPIGGNQVYQFVWDVNDIPRQEMQLWVYVGDAAGNFGYGRVESVRLIDFQDEIKTSYQKALPEPGRMSP